MNHLLSPSELILNADGSVYHLNLLPEQLTDTVILVGDPDRADLIKEYFDQCEYSCRKREFITHSGRIGTKELSVVSTGIGTDNIDIVLTELDILASIDLEKRVILEKPRQLSLIRLGTSGALNPEIQAGDILVSEFALGLDNLMGFYNYSKSAEEDEGLGHCQDGLQQAGIILPNRPYFASRSWDLAHPFMTGITVTCPGFYGPQGRNLKGLAAFPGILDVLSQIDAFRGQRISNLEMETAGIYAMASMLGHRALSVSAILANRFNGSFSRDPSGDVKNMIEKCLELLSGEEAHSR